MWQYLGNKVAMTARMACLIFLILPLDAHAADFAITPHQQKMLDAMRNTSEFKQAWNEPWALSTMEDSLRRWAFIRRCLPRPDQARLFEPAYRKYVATVGNALYLRLQAPAVAGGMLWQRQALWAIDQLNEVQYAHSMRLLTSAHFARLRAINDLGSALSEVLGNLTDVSSGSSNVALLVRFKQTLVQTGQLEPVLTALGKVDPNLLEAFTSLEFLWPVPADKWEQWEGLALNLQVHGERIQEAYWNSWPESMRKQLERYRDDPLSANLNRAQEAEQAWSHKKTQMQGANVDVATLNGAEHLGRQIYFYFGEPRTEALDAELLKIFDWLRQQSMAYIDEHKAQMCGSP